MRMPFFNQTTHPLFFIAVHLLKRKLFVSQRKWISLHKFQCISFKLELIIRTTSQFYRAFAHHSIFLIWKAICVEEFAEGNLFEFGRSVGYQWKDRRKSYFGLVFIILSCSKEVIASSGVAAFVIGLKTIGDILFITSPIRVIRSTKKRSEMFSIPSISIKRAWLIIHKEECSLVESLSILFICVFL